MKNKKKFSFVLVAGLLAVILAVTGTVVAATGSFNRSKEDAGDPVPFDATHGTSTVTREQREAEEQKIKEQLMEGNADGVSLVSTSPMTSEEKAELDEKFKVQGETGKRLQETFLEGVEIVERYQPGGLKKDAGQLDKVDRTVLATMVDVLHKYKLDPHEEEVLKCCLAEKYCIILGTDPLYEEIEELLKAG